MRIGLTYDLRDDYRALGFSEEAVAEFDSEETIASLEAALQRLRRLPSHMAYNLVLADASGQVASVELLPGGGLRS